jgi:CRP/FNR family transcriptional regulator, cyclic AMP receptor protein
MDAELRSAVSMSPLRGLPAEVLDGLLAGSTRTRVPAGSVTHREGEPDPHLELVVAGVVRVFVTAPDGRTMTVRYSALAR